MSMDQGLLEHGREMTMHMRTGFLLVLAVGSIASIGCGSGGSSTESTGTQRASLHRSKGCGDLLADLKADAVYKLNKGIDQQIQSIRRCVSRYGEDRCGGYGASFGGGGDARNSAENGAPAPQAPGSSLGGEKDSASSYSQTNTQVKGVDEADFVKNDGNNIYVLHGRAFKVLKAWPADQLGELSSIDIEGTPQEMFVSGGKVVVYSQVNGTGIFAAAGVTPKEQYRDYYGSGGGGGMAEPAPSPGVPREDGQPSGPYVPLTKITVLTLDGATPTVAREVYFEGGYLSSRRVDTQVRTVLQSYAHGPKLKYGIYELYSQESLGDPQNSPYPKTSDETIQALEQLRAHNRAAIDASVLSDWLPYTFVKNGQAVSTQTVACEDFYVPTAGTTESGLTEVASLDLADPAATPRQTAILGRADTVYGNAGTLYLAARAWAEPQDVWFDDSSSGDSAVGVSPPSTDTAPPPSGPSGTGSRSLRPQTTPTAPVSIRAIPTNRTHIHKFEFATDPKFPNYVASGTVAGNVKNQFSLDEKDGKLRVATTENRIYVDGGNRYISPTQADAPSARPSTVNRVFVLGQNGAWLDVVGDVGELAPNEQVYSVRFVEDRGYVVTFRRVDPLFVVDLATPTTPRVLAALKIPGFSEYMHPLDANHLLTIGRDATSEGRAQGLQLQIFDVTDGTNPILQHKFTYTGSEYGQSEAEHDHKAFTYFADRKLLAFPYYSYGSGGDGMRSSLELFKVDLATGFQPVGSIDHTALFSQAPKGYCGGYYGPSVRRGVFLENFVYSISYGGVVVKNADDLSATGSQLALPSPQVNPGYGPDACF